MLWMHECRPSGQTMVTTTGRRVLSSRSNGPLMARTPPPMIRVEAFWLVEPGGLEPELPLLTLDNRG